MYLSSFELCSIAAFIALIIYSLKMCIMDGLATKLYQQINREKLLRGELEDKVRTLMDLETQILEIDKQQKQLHRDISSKKEQLANDHKLFRSLVDKQDHLNHQIQRQRETAQIKEEEFQRDVCKIEQQMELRKAQFISKISLYNKEIDAYNEQELTLRKIVSALREEKAALKTMQELERTRTQKSIEIEESRLLLADLSEAEEKINTDIRKKLSAINSMLGTTTFVGNTPIIDAEQIVSPTN